MMGRKVRQAGPLPAVSREDLVPLDHFYRHLDRVLDLGFVHDLVGDAYAAGGRTSIDPVVFFKLQLVMFFEGIRSERLLMRLVADRLSIRWYLGYNLQEPVPDHSSLTRIRSRYGLAIFRRFFEAIVEQCQQAGLVWGRDWIAETGRQRREAHGRYLRTADIRISSTDPDATPLRLKGGGTHLGYQTHCVVDGGKRHIILGVLVTPGEVMENQPMLDLAWHVRFRWKLHPRQVTGDTKYGTEENIQGVEDMGIRAYMPLPDWEQNSAYFSASKFIYDAEQDHYVCPNGQVLRRTHTSEATQRVQYRALASVCRTCPLKAQCTPSETGQCARLGKTM